MTKPLRLLAKDAEDLAVLSACLQDAILPIGEMCFEAAEKRFVLVANRFKWESRETGPNGDGPTADDDHLYPYERTHCGVQFSGIEAAGTRGINLRDRHQMLELLSLTTHDEGVLLTFAGGGQIRLKASAWTCCAEDIGEPWPTANCPCHPLDNAAD